MQIFDSHFHIIDNQYPLRANHGFMPEEFLVTNYQHEMRHHNLIGGAIISGSFQDFDYSYVEPALKKLGSTFVATIQVQTDIHCCAGNVDWLPCAGRPACDLARSHAASLVVATAEPNRLGRA